MNNVSRIICLFVLGGFAVAADVARPANPAQAGQVQVIEVTAQ